MSVTSPLDILTHLDETFVRGPSKLTQYQKSRSKIPNDYICIYIPSEHLEVWTKYPEKKDDLIKKYKHRDKLFINVHRGSSFTSKFEV